MDSVWLQGPGAGVRGGLGALRGGLGALVLERGEASGPELGRQVCPLVAGCVAEAAVSP